MSVRRSSIEVVTRIGLSQAVDAQGGPPASLELATTGGSTDIELPPFRGRRRIKISRRIPRYR